ncbi:MAG: hypothetical protein JSV53_12075, partial [candidate division WOR-3 bacterium]
YDAAGRLISALAEGMTEPGYYTVHWNGLDDQGRQVPAGVYFVRLETPDSRQVKKAVLLK